MPSPTTIQLGDGNRAVVGGLVFAVRRSSAGGSITIDTYWVMEISGRMLDVDPHLGAADVDTRDDPLRPKDWRPASGFIGDVTAYLQEFLTTLAPRTGRAQREANRRLESITDRLNPKEPESRLVPRRAEQ